MSPYVFVLALGATGLAAMALLGVGHHGGGAGHHVGHRGGHAGHAGHHGHDVGHHAGPHAAQAHGSTLGRLLGLLSPRAIFSMLVGAGATGVLLRPLLLEPLTLAAAVV